MEGNREYTQKYDNPRRGRQSSSSLFDWPDHSKASNVTETWNEARSFILYGKGGEIATNDLKNQELTMLALNLPQIGLVYINTLWRRVVS
jgi:hypothetical protein